MEAQQRWNASNVSDDEAARRSFLMRLYRSRMEGESHYLSTRNPGYDAINDSSIADEFVGMGWVEPVGPGWRITETGVRRWAEMCRSIIAGSAGNWYGTRFNELKWLLGLPVARVKQTRGGKLVLARLAESGGKLPLREGAGRAATERRRQPGWIRHHHQRLLRHHKWPGGLAHWPRLGGRNGNEFTGG